MTIRAGRRHGRGFRSVQGLPFDQQVAGYVKKYKLRMELFMPLFVERFAEELMFNTPVDTGLLRGSWLLGFHSNLRRAGVPDPTGTDTLNAMVSRVGEWNPNRKIYFANSAPYSWWVEEGTSKMAPRYYIRKTVAAAPLIAEEVARDILATT